MRVLVLAHNDSDNLMILNIIKELLRKNHEIKIYAHLTDMKSIRMFKELDVSVLSSKELTEESIEWANLILSALRAHINFDRLGEKIFSKKYIFVYNHYIDNTWHTPGADFMFTCGYTRHPIHVEDCASMPIGCPKNDHVLTIDSKVEYKNFLFIDSGHYPFSHKGKMQIVDMLINICKAYPEYTLTIKPRFLPTDTNMLHANYDHLYNLIHKKCNENVPSNLIMLYEHLDMQDLLDQCCCAIMLCTSAYVDVALRNKNMIIIKGVENEDKYELRNDVEYKNIYDLREKSGCVVDIEDVIDYLPNGLKCKEDHLNQLVAYRINVSTKIVEVMEYIYANFLKKNEFPDIKEYSYESYRMEMLNSDRLTWDILLYKRLKNIGNDRLNILNRVTVKCDYTKLYDLIDKEYINYEISINGVKDFLDEFNRIYSNIWINEKEKFREDPLNQAQYMDVLFKLKKYNALIFLPEEKIICKGVWHFYIGIICYYNNVFEESKEHLIMFLKEARTRNFAKYYCEEYWGIKEAICKIVDMHIKHYQEMSTEEFVEIYLMIFEKQMENRIPYRKTLWNIALKVSKELLQNEEYYLASQIMEKYISESSNFYEEKKCIGELIAEIKHIKKSFSYRVGFALTFIPRKLRKCIKSITEKRLWNVFEQIKIRINNTLFYRMTKEFRINILKGYDLYEEIIKTYGDDSYIELGALGTGNVYICGLYYKEYIEGKKRVGTDIYLLPEKNCFDVAQLFSAIDRIQLINCKQYMELISLIRYMGEPNVHIDYLYYHNLGAQYTGILTWFEGIRGWNMKTIYDAVFFNTINNEGKIEPLKNTESSDDLFINSGLIKGKTVILSPYAGTMRKMSDIFWIGLVKHLQKKGFCVCTNVSGDKELPIEGTEGVFCPYSKMLSFVENAGYFVGLRSGLLDIIESANCRKVALYTSIIQRRGFTDESGLASFSLNEMFQRYDWLELETKPSNLNDVIEEILEYFEK